MAGRPKKKIEAEQVLALAQLGCTTKEIAAFFHCHDDTINSRFQKELNEGRANLKISLRRAQIRLALGDEKTSSNATMLIWLGKQILKQAETPIITQDEIAEDNGRSELLQELSAKIETTRNDGIKSDPN